MRRRPARLALGLLLTASGAVALLYGATWLMVWRDARARLAAPPAMDADAALVLGSRAYLDGRPNPCLTGRVDAALRLARAGQVPRLVFSGGVDREDGRIEAEVMLAHAQQAGYAGSMQLERASRSTRENLALSLPMLRAGGARRVLIVSEPYHLWRVERLVRASGFDRAFDHVGYIAAPSSCWSRWGMAYRGALREPLAIVKNAVDGYFD